MSAIDRLEEFKLSASKLLQEQSAEPLKEPLLDKQPSEESPVAGEMKEFMAKIDIAQQKLEVLMRNNDKIKELTEMYSTQSLATEASKISQSVDTIATENAELYKTLNTIVNRIKDDIASEETAISDLELPAKTAYESSPEYRMKKSIHGAFIGRFQEVLKQTNALQAEFKKAVQNNIKNQLRIANPKLTEEELETQVADPEQGKILLSQQILGVHERVKSTIKDIEDKYKEILALEKSVMQVHQMFETLAGLVHEQSEMLDNIEHNMQEARNYVDKGEKNVVNAKKWYQQTRTVYFTWVIMIANVLHTWTGGIVTGGAGYLLSVKGLTIVLYCFA